MPVFYRSEFIKDSLVQRWLASISEDPATHRTYSIGLFYYHIYTGRTPLELVEDQRKFLATPVTERDPREGAKYRLEQFQLWLQESHSEIILRWRESAGKGGALRKVERSFQAKSRNSVKRIVGAARSFYGYFELPVPRLRRMRGRRLVRESTRTYEIVRAIQFANIREQAIIMLAAVTGRSPSDIFKLRVQDVDRARFPGWGFLYNPELARQKTGAEMISWVTPEALHIIDLYLETRRAHPSSWLFTEHAGDREKRLKTRAAGALLLRLAEEIFPEFHDGKGNLTRNPINFRNLRQWFGTQCSHLPSFGDKEILMGHVLPHGGAYHAPPIDELFLRVKQLYEDGYTRILTTPEQHQIQELADRIRSEVTAEFQGKLDSLREELIPAVELLRSLKANPDILEALKQRRQKGKAKD